MDADLTHEQLANLTPEQIEAAENDPSALAGFLAAQTANDDPEQAVKDGAANGAGDDEEPVVLTKNGKGIIPYESHKQLRVENATLREQIEGMTKKLESLTQAKTDAEGDPEATEIADDAIARHLESMKMDMPELHEVIQAVMSKSERLEKTVDELTREKADATRKNAQSVVEQVAEAKDNNPDLVHWEANDPESWDEALKQDEILRTNAKWKDKPYAERFDEVVRRVRAVRSEASTPNKQPAKPGNARETAKAKIDAAPVRKPTTLSDMQGGGTPLTQQELAENLSPHELLAAVMKMPEHKAAAMRAELD